MRKSRGEARRALGLRSGDCRGLRGAREARGGEVRRESEERGERSEERGERSERRGAARARDTRWARRWA